MNRLRVMRHVSLAAVRRVRPSPAVLLAVCAALLPVAARGAVHVTLANGFDVVCNHTGVAGAQTRLYMDGSATNYIVVATSAIRSAQFVATPAPQAPATMPTALGSEPRGETLSAAQLSRMLSEPGHAHDLDTDLLLSVVHAESAGRTDARSRAGAEGLMQLMPGTAKQLGVADAWMPRDNISGGTAYLDALLRRYHDDLALALAAYNAGPRAVDRWHGIPPYRETRAYVARIIHEYNRRYRARQAATLAMAAPVPRP